MYKAILCDDDEIIAQGLNRFIPWEKLGIYMCGFCYDGLRAKELVDQFEPDIIVTDVCMPIVSGLELIQYAKAKNPNVKAIVISGYDDFKYAQESIKIGALDYILKPVDEQELISVLKRAVEDCKEFEKKNILTVENNKYYRDDQMKCLIYEGLAAFVNRFGQESYRNLQKTACGIIIASVDNYEYLAFHLTESEQKEINSILYNCMQKYGENITAFEKRMGTVGCYILGDNEDEIRIIRNSYISDVREALKNELKDQTVTFGCSNIYSSITHMPDAYHEAVAALQERFVYSPGSDIYYKRISHKPQRGEEREFDTILDINELVALIKQGNKEKINCMLDDMQKQLLEIGGKSYLYMKIITGNIFAKLLNELYELDITEADLGINSLDEYQKISDLQSVDLAIAHLRKILLHIVEIMEKNNSHKYYKVISMVENYIETHYMEHDLSMDKVARQVHMSTSYFSVIFKNEKGVSFTDYLIRTRIDKAKELMRHTDLKAYEISLKVGYDTAAYFSTAFKKVTGYSPSEYKKMVIDNRV